MEDSVKSGLAMELGEGGRGRESVVEGNVLYKLPRSLFCALFLSLHVHLQVE